MKWMPRLADTNAVKSKINEMLVTASTLLLRRKRQIGGDGA
jgi:hypothetical protein